MVKEWNPREDAWFAGFVDGEGCFWVARYQAAGGTPSYYPRFEVCLRVDDMPILEKLQAAFGGRLYTTGRPQWGNPRAQWNVSTKRDVAGLVAYFDRFPLRAKKARDYAIWRQMVSIYIQRHGGGVDHDGRLAALREALLAGRSFAPPRDAPEANEPHVVQMTLGGS